MESSNIKAVGYDPASKTLEVEFKNGAVYQHSGVPQDLADRMVHSESVGGFYNKMVKSTFKGERVGA